MKKFLLHLGHVQAQIILFLLFWLVISPYAIVLRLLRYNALPQAGWVKAEDRQDLDMLRRMF